MARVALFDPRTNLEVTKRFISEGVEVPFNAAPGASAVVAWPINVPADADLVNVRITATGAGIASMASRRAVDLPDPCGPDKKSRGTCPAGAAAMLRSIQVRT